jgi:hypothetical protein
VLVVGGGALIRECLFLLSYSFLLSTPHFVHACITPR